MKKSLALALWGSACVAFATGTTVSEETATTAPGSNVVVTEEDTGEVAVTEEDVSDEAIVVTAAPLPKYRVESSTAGTLIDLPPEKSPFTVDSLTEDFIRERNATDLDQLISMQPGIYQGGKTVMARQAGTYNIRGYSGSEVLLNGVPLSGGVATFFDPTLLERIDIVKGPVGGAYGSQMGSMSDLMGAGGSILLQPKQASFDEEFTELLFKGSYSRQTGSRVKFAIDTNQIFAEDAFAVRLPAAYEWREPGWAPKGAHGGTMFTAAPSSTWKISDRLKAGLDLFYQYSDQPAYQGIRMLNGKPYNTGWDDTYTRKEDRMKFQSWGATFRLDGEVNDWLSTRTRLSMLESKNRYNYRGPYSNIGFSPTNPSKYYEYAAGDRLVRNWYAGQDFIFNFNTADVEHKFLLGVNGTLKESQGWSWFGTPDTTTSESSQRKLGLVAQEVATWKGLSLLAGVRADWHDSVNHAHAWTFSPRVGLSYDVAEAGKVILFANYAITDTPNFNLKRWTTTIGSGKNQITTGESSQYLDSTWRAEQKEAGIRVQAVEGLWLSGTLFRIDQSNAPIAMSEFSFSDETFNYYADDGRTYSQGVELSASGNITDAWSIYAAYAYIDYYDKTNGLRFDRFPPHAASFWTSYKADWLGGAVLGFGGRWREAWMMTFRGGPAGEDQRVRRLITFDASIDFPMTDELSLGFAVRNLFNSRGVESARNLQAFANDARTFELSMRWRF